jgi:DNA-binding response OmpR family regulator
MAYILIVDDDKDLAQAYSKILTDEGHEVHIELETETAFENIDQKVPDLIILDAMFPENRSGGFDFAREISSKFTNKNNIPILMLTAVNQVFQLGLSKNNIDEEWVPISDLLEKPVDFEVLKEKVAELLKKES